MPATAASISSATMPKISSISRRQSGVNSAEKLDPLRSQPSSAHPDQLYPNRPIDEDHALRTRDGKAASGVRLRTSQERVFVQGSESVRFTVSLVDEAGRTQPLRVKRAWAHELPKPNTASLFPEVPLNFNDDGTVLTARVYPRYEQSTAVEAFADGGELRLHKVQAWRMRSAWSNR